MQYKSMAIYTYYSSVAVHARRDSGGAWNGVLAPSLFRSLSPIFMDPSFSIVQLRMTIQTIDIAFINLCVQSLPRNGRQAYSAYVKRFVFRIPVMKTKRGRALGVPASKALVPTPSEQFLLNAFSAFFM